MEMTLQNKENFHRYEKICNDIEELKQSMEILNNLVIQQGHDLDTFEDFIEISKTSTIEATKDLQESYNYYKYTGYILLSTTIPLTFLFGLKGLVITAGGLYILSK